MKMCLIEGWIVHHIWRDEESFLNYAVKAFLDD